MARYIDADALIAEYDRVHIGPAGGARKLMVDAPTVDAVEVVRCKDCKRFLEMETSPSYDGKCLGYGYLVEARHYCSYGVPKMKCESCKIHKEMPETACCAWYRDNVVCGDKTTDECTEYVPCKLMKGGE